MNKKGFLIVFEGPDGVGKTTLAKELYSHIRMMDQKVVYLSFPGKEDGTLGKLIYDFHHQPNSFGVTEVSQTSLQVLHIAAHIDAIEKYIKPYLLSGTSVILDRYWWSTWAYGNANGVDSTTLKAMIDLELLHWGDVSPDVLFLIQRASPFRKELSSSKLTNIVNQYIWLAKDQSSTHPIVKVNNSGNIDVIVSDIVSSLKCSIPSLSKDNERTYYNIKTNKAPHQESFFTEDHSYTPIPLELSAYLIERFSPAKPTEVFFSYWKFAAERQNIFFNRFNNESQPWTDDPILRTYKFTNAYRASDRVSQFLIKNVIYNYDWSAQDALFRVLLFRLFNKIETWQTLESKFGPITSLDFVYKKYESTLSKEMNSGRTIFSAAYIMPSRAKNLRSGKKHRNILKAIEMMMKDDLHLRLPQCKEMESAFELLKTYPMIGDFLAYQLAIDLNYSTLINFSENSFVMPGPGALDGIKKCFDDLGGYNQRDIIHMVTDLQDEIFDNLNIEFKSLWGRKLHLIDCQNLFCEISKYSRIAHPHIQGNSGRTRIKQKYTPKTNQINYWYPPKWNINDKIKKVE